MDREHQEGTTVYTVVVNHEDQYSIWPADTEKPKGWTYAGKTGPKSECLAYIKEVWVDMRPLSLRKTAERTINTDAAHPEYPCIHHLFEAQVVRTPDAVALVYEDEQLTYQQLDHRANRLARHLQGLGVKPEIMVGICVERSIEMVVGILGIMKAGGAYVPLDPGYPKQRLSFIIQETQVPILLTQKPLLEELPENKAQIVCLDSDWNSIRDQSKEDPSTTISGKNLAYVIFTSGSTGMPKGVMVAHMSLWHYVHDLQAPLGVSSDDVYLHTASISFSSSIRQLMLPITHGAAVSIATPEQKTDPLMLLDLVKRRNITVIDLNPAYFRICSDALQRLEPQSRNILLDNKLRLVFSTSEPLPFHVARKFSLVLGRNAGFINLYGSTETTGTVISYKIPAKDDSEAKTVPIGRPIANAQIYVLDQNNQPVPVGTSGELYLAGLRVARGYLNRPELTAEVFLPDSLSDESGAILYKTGDLARYLPYGNIEFVGRVDNQVSIRGFRVELEEIEVVLGQHPMVRDVALVAADGQNEEKRLVAYIVPVIDEPPKIAEFRSFLKTKLPEYMIPAVFVFLDTLPLLPNGKIDRPVLPAIGRTRPEFENNFAPPHSCVEKVLTEIWARALNLDRLGINDDFFELGGDSLLATRVIHELRGSFHVDLTLGDLFKNPTVSELASEIELRKSKKEDGHPAPELPTILPAQEELHMPFSLTDVQQAYWIGRSGFLELGQVSTHRYIEIESFDLNLKQFAVAWQHLIERHEMLRAVVLPDGLQQILEQVPPYEIEVLDLREKDADTVQVQLQSVRQRMSHQVLPSDKWPLFEIRASHLDDNHFRLHFSFDALILDIWSRFILFREWEQLYQNPKATLKPLDLSFRDYVLAESELQNSEFHMKSQSYWLNRLHTLPPAPDLPLSKNPASVTRPRFVQRNSTLAANAWLRLKQRAALIGLTPSGILLAAFSDVLRLWSKNPAFTINLTLFNRLPMHPHVNDIVGDFTSLTLLEAGSPTREDTFEIRARSLQQQLWNDLDHRYFSGIQVLREFSRKQGETLRAEMPVVFTSALPHNTMAGNNNPMSWIGEVKYTITQTPQVWIDHQVFEESGALLFNWDTVDELFPEGLLSDMFDSYCGLLQRLADDNGSWKDTWPGTAEKLLPAAQLAKRQEVNATHTPLHDEMLHNLFEDQVPQRPDQPAVVATGKTLTYEELFRRSNQIGHQLRNLGARPNTLVAVVMEKGWEQVVAVLGIHMSGAAYLPIDAGFPKERLWHLLEHAEVEHVLTQSSVVRSLEWPEGLKRICVDEDDSLYGVKDQPLKTIQKPEDLAYVIYTSGSTGLPKGVAIDHRGAVNTILDINKRFGVGSNDRVLALSSLSFDLSVYDIFGTLAAGGSIVVPEKGATRDPSIWAKLISQENVTIWNSVPALMELLVDYLTTSSVSLESSLRLIMLSGDWIPLTLPDQIKAQFDRAQTVSLGGATEASIWSILYPVEGVDPAWKSIPYGRPMVNQQFHVLNDAFSPCPVWVPGQLFIGGIGLAKGYWRDKERTQKSFVTNPQTGERFYRTGDLGRFLPDGNIEFMGREDNQVKIQGFRVELGEIEATIGKHPEVRSVAVKALGEKERRRLAVYVVPEPGAVLSEAELRQLAQQKLPDYMVPSAFVMLEELPLTPNGKIDRKALPDPVLSPAESEQHFPVEASDLTARIARIVASVLGIDQIDFETNLLRLGATSVDMIRIANRLESELDFRPKMDGLYHLPTVSGLARSHEQHVLERRGAEETKGKPVELTPESVLASYQPILDPEERNLFKDKQPGLRRIEDERPSVRLDLPDPDEAMKKRYTERRSHRRFSVDPIPFARLSELLECLRQIKIDEKPKYLYGSAGGLYPVQTYLYIKPGRVENLDPGIYYYHPSHCRLTLLSGLADFDRDVYDPIINGPIFDEAAFAVFLIAQLSAIAPMYGKRGMHYATIEAGLMSQLLETLAPGCGIGLCQIGNLNFKRIEHLFELDQSHVLAHSLLGGLIDIHNNMHWSPFQEALGHEPAIVGEREEGEI